MIKLTLTGLGVAMGGLALCLGAGVSSAAPDLGPAVNTTCSYPQLVSALKAQGPQASAVFDESPVLQAGLMQFLNSAPDKRQQMAAEFASAPQVAPYLPTIQSAFSTCNSF